MNEREALKAYWKFSAEQFIKGEDIAKLVCDVCMKKISEADCYLFVIGNTLKCGACTEHSLVRWESSGKHRNDFGRGELDNALAHCMSKGSKKSGQFSAKETIMGVEDKNENIVNENNMVLDCPEEQKYDTSKCQKCGKDSDYVGYVHTGIIEYQVIDTGSTNYTYNTGGKKFSYPIYDCSVSIPYKSIRKIKIGICNNCVLKQKKGEKITGGLFVIFALILLIIGIMQHKPAALLSVLVFVLILSFLGGIFLKRGFEENKNYERHLKEFFQEQIKDAIFTVIFSLPFPKWCLAGFDYSKKIELSSEDMLAIGETKSMKLIWSKGKIVQYLAKAKRGVTSREINHENSVE